MSASVLARTAAVFLAALVAGVLLAAQERALDVAERRQAASEAARASADAIHQRLEGALHKKVELLRTVALMRSST